MLKRKEEMNNAEKWGEIGKQQERIILKNTNHRACSNHQNKYITVQE